MKTKKMVINKTELLLNSKNKLGKHIDYVRTGTGSHKDKKKYDRKDKKTQRIKNDLKGYLIH